MRGGGLTARPNTDSRRVGAVLAATFGASAIGSAYLPLWFSDRGLTAAEIGTVLGAAALLRIAGVPGGGWLADWSGRRRTILMAAGVVAAAASSLLPALHGMAALMLATAVLGLAASLLAPLIDAVTLALAGARRLEYGPTRAWGSVAYMVATAGGGALLARVGTGAAPWLLAGFYGAATVLMLRLPDVAAGPRRGGGVLALLRDRRFRLALLATALIQGSHAAYYSFAPLHWRAAGLGDTVIGLLIAEGIVAEVALFLYGQRLAERLGAAGLTACAAVACLVRWTALAFVTDIAALAVVQLLHAATFAFQHLSAMAVLRGLPPGRAGMAQALMSAIGFAASTAALVWLTGQLFERWGGLSFLPMAVVGGAALFTVRPLARALRT